VRQVHWSWANRSCVSDTHASVAWQSLRCQSPTQTHDLLSPSNESSRTCRQSSRLNLALITVDTGHWKRFSRTFQDLSICVLQDLPGPFMSILHVFPGLFNPVDIEQVRFSYNTDYVTQFIIILNNRSNRVWQWAMITYIKAKNMDKTRGRNVATTWFIFHDFSGPWPNSMTFRAWKIWFLNSVTFNNLPGPVHIPLMLWYHKITVDWSTENSVKLPT